uniref:Uncharacterized protein n=1 Tax=Timema tahoe TaxID=61484 RepID=A0A7R9IRD6_9NEOP|nr:unnamed protein product [Timema tahoe]
MENHLDCLYRSCVWGLQAGVFSWGTTWLAQFLRLPVTGEVTPCTMLFLGLAVGMALAALLDTVKGLVVFAGCLFANGEGARKLKNYGRKNMHVIQLNVTSDDEVKDAVEYVQSHLPPNGRIVNVASGLGRQCAPNRSSYGITKYGVEALTDCLRFEMRKWGVTVAMIEPGNFVNATGIFTPESIRREADSLWKKIPPQVQKDYTKTYFDGVINNMIFYSTKGTSDKSSVLDAMTQALLHRFPHPRYQPMEAYFKLRTWVNTHLPEWIYEYFYT